MNDFTKEELIQIYNFIERNKQYSYNDMRFKIIEEKLQSMIDNYCDHEWQEDLHHLDIELCSKCGKRTWWENVNANC
jgi:hypothetical protein